MRVKIVTNEEKKKGKPKFKPRPHCLGNSRRGLKRETAFSHWLKSVVLLELSEDLG